MLALSSYLWSLGCQIVHFFGPVTMNIGRSSIQMDSVDPEWKMAQRGNAMYALTLIHNGFSGVIDGLFENQD